MSAVTEPVILDSTGQAIKEAVLSIASAIEAKSGVIYAFHIDGAEGDPASKITYLKDAVGMKPAKMD